MECLNFAKLLEYDTENPKALWKYLSDEMERMLEKKLLTEDMNQLINRNSIIKFLQSPVALRMAKAAARGDLYTEKPFVMDYEGILVQGIIDVFWLEEGKIVLMDYKTDRVAAPEELITRYATQLQLYGQALSRVFSKAEGPKLKTENLIYSFALDRVIPVQEDGKTEII
jgi:ATP-dependent helicase/nuclease subunit A